MSDDREQRNQVFNQPPGPAIDPAIKRQTEYDKVKADFNLDIPIEIVPLPSGGKVYPLATGMHGKDRVEIKAMTAREEDILTSRAYLKKGTVVSELIKSCLLDKSVNVSDLLTGDRNALMVAIRITGYGADYDAEVDCNECSVKSNQKFDLSALPIQPLELEPAEPGKNVFEFKLPYSKKVVKFKFTTGRDEEEMVTTQERQKKMNLAAGDSAVTTNLKMSIVSVDGIEDRAKISSFVNMLPARDSLALRNYIRDNEPGVRMKQEVVCPACGHAEEVSMPIGTSFLWPQTRG